MHYSGFGKVLERFFLRDVLRGYDEEAFGIFLIIFVCYSWMKSGL